MNKFLGRVLNTNTMMWEFQDGSGVPLPEELRQQMLMDIENPVGGTIVALDRKWRYEDAHLPHNRTKVHFLQNHSHTDGRVTVEIQSVNNRGGGLTGAMRHNRLA
jgi:hypothetical protein